MKYIERVCPPGCGEYTYTDQERYEELSQYNSQDPYQDDEDDSIDVYVDPLDTYIIDNTPSTEEFNSWINK